jgi:hypothetical protein
MERSTVSWGSVPTLMRQTDALGPRRDRREHDGGRGRGEVLAVMLTDAVHVQSHLVGELGLLDHLAQSSTVAAHLLDSLLRVGLGEGGDADLDARRHGDAPLSHFRDVSSLHWSGRGSVSLRGRNQRGMCTISGGVR